MFRLAAGCAAALGLSAAAADRELHAAAKDLADLSLEQLANVVVTSPSRRSERLLDVPASLYVITAEDIRRSGVTSLAEALRLAPNLNVARLDNDQYAISARSFNNQIANKMLVMIDGRTVYTPLFSGVFWDAQDVILEDVERIEVISGPAAAVWGSNAVNGVINVITASAAKTQGPLLAAGAGDRKSGVVARHGLEVGADAFIRLYARYFDRDAGKLEGGGDKRDESERAFAGLRFDLERPRSKLTVQAGAYEGEFDQVPAGRETSGAHLLARWTRELDDGSGLRLQAYYDRTEREHRTAFAEKLEQFDFEFQHSPAPWRAHRIQWGAGVRQARDDVANTASQAFEPPKRTLNWANAFVQDVYPLRDDLALTLGMKAERNPYTGTEFLPNARLGWQFAPEQLLWGALSRAVRAPSRIDREFFVPGAEPFVLVGTTSFSSEVSKVAEVGYRGQVTPRFSLSATAFYHRHVDLRSVEPFEGALRFANDIRGRTTGVEGWATFRVTPAWRLSGGLVETRQRLRVEGGREDLGGMAALGNDPRRYAMLRSSWNAGRDWGLDVIVRHTGALPDPSVPSYTVADVRVAWTPRPGLELSLAAQNLAGDGHVEFGAPGNRVEFERGVFAMIRWTP